MKIIGGSRRGAKLFMGKSAYLRPTSAAVREALFNIILSGKFDFNISEAIVLDLFAGSGALGLEALSRGANFSYFIEREPQTISVLQRNIDYNLPKCLYAKTMGLSTREFSFMRSPL